MSVYRFSYRSVVTMGVRRQSQSLDIQRGSVRGGGVGRVAGIVGNNDDLVRNRVYTAYLDN